MTIPNIIIAIDGYSSTGKSSFAKLIAKEYDFMYIDSGAIYRAVTYHALNESLIDNENNIDELSLVKSLNNLMISFEGKADRVETYINGNNVEDKIRTMEVSSHVSPIATIAAVRDFVNLQLRAVGQKGRLVMDGRDIGTTVFPNAQLKIFMIALEQIRASRRFSELKNKGQNPDIQEVIDNIRERDYIDSHRKISPLKKAEDAIIMDNSFLSLEEQMQVLSMIVKNKFNLR